MDASHYIPNLPDCPGPAYVLDKRALIRNAQTLENVQSQSGAKVLLALKAFASFMAFPLFNSRLSGTTASSIHEAQLGADYFGKEIHTYAPAYTHTDAHTLPKIASHIVFNSWGQVDRWGGVMRGVGESVGRDLSFGVRVNPGYSEVGVQMYDPCRVGSRLGIPIDEVRRSDWGRIEGLHFHTMCEQGSDVLGRTLEVFEGKLGDRLSELKWVNFGGGHHITRDDYDLALLNELVGRIREKYGVRVYLEPGEAAALNAGYLVATVLDVIENAGRIAILDVSATAHMPDVLEMPYRPVISGAGNPGEKAYDYRLGGLTCLAGDEIGTYSFAQPLEIGQKLVFHDMAIYSIVKNTMFNGVPLPSILLWDSETGAIENRRDFGYEDYRDRLS